MLWRLLCCYISCPDSSHCLLSSWQWRRRSWVFHCRSGVSQFPWPLGLTARHSTSPCSLKPATNPVGTAPCSWEMEGVDVNPWRLQNSSIFSPELYQQGCSGTSKVPVGRHALLLEQFVCKGSCVRQCSDGVAACPPLHGHAPRHCRAQEACLCTCVEYRFPLETSPLYGQLKYDTSSPWFYGGGSRSQNGL